MSEDHGGKALLKIFFKEVNKRKEKVDQWSEKGIDNILRKLYDVHICSLGDLFLHLSNGDINDLIRARGELAFSADTIELLKNIHIVFGYGSNSSAQLRGRCQNPSLVTYPARLDGYVRIFCGVAGRWGGAPASVSQSSTSGSTTFGSIAYLSTSEKKLLDTFEGGYTFTPVNVTAIYLCDGVSAEATIPAFCYIKDDHTWNESYPSEAYLTSINCHLGEHFIDKTTGCRNASIDIRKSSAVTTLFGATSSSPMQEQRIEVVGTWQHPGPGNLKSLEAVTIEVNHFLLELKWTVPAVFEPIRKVFAVCGIETSAQLLCVCANREKRLIACERITRFVEEQNLQSKLPLPQTVHLLDLFANALNGYIFVYGSLRQHQRNHSVLARNGINSRVEGIFLTTNKYHMIGLISGGYPFLLDIDIPGHQSTFITGEVYRIDHDCLSLLDQFEGDEYERRPIECFNADSNMRLNAFVYLAKRATAVAIVDQFTASEQSSERCVTGRFEYVVAGDWAAFLGSKRA